MNQMSITAMPLTKSGFKPFGQVISAEGPSRALNQGMSRKWDYLAELDMLQDGGKINLGVLRTSPCSLFVRQMERHHFTSQIFIPLEGKRSLVVVSPPTANAPDPNQIHAFLMEGNQGISFRRLTWHHTLIPLEGEMDFITIARGSDKPDVELVALPEPIEILLPG